MTDTPPKPKRRRWRWLVVAVLLLAGGVGVWWFWPVGDARLVGSWTSQHARTGYWEFRRNGVAVWNSSSPNSPTAVAGYTTWQVKNNILQLGDPLISTSHSWRAWILQQWNNVSPFDQWILSSTSFRIVEVSRDKLVLLSTDFQAEGDTISSGDTETLTRIRE
jgi:hypothetical protein